MLARFFRHFVSAYGLGRRLFPAETRRRLTDAIARAEQGHVGEICCVVESSLTPLQLLHGLSARGRALQLFADLHVWDTARNSGVLVYLLLADRAVEIVADRGLHPQGDAYWPQAAARIREGFQSANASAGCIEAITLIGDFLRSEFPATGGNPDELPNPVRLL